MIKKFLFLFPIFSLFLLMTGCGKSGEAGIIVSHEEIIVYDRYVPNESDLRELDFAGQRRFHQLVELENNLHMYGIIFTMRERPSSGSRYIQVSEEYRVSDYRTEIYDNMMEFVRRGDLFLSDYRISDWDTETRHELVLKIESCRDYLEYNY